MKSETRRVAVFIIVGLIAAAVIGVGVWRASAPASPSASDTATPTRAVSTASTSTHSDVAASPEIAPSSEEERQERVGASTPLLDDPLLPPNAVLGTEPVPVAPTTVYRPENIFTNPPTTAATGDRGRPTGLGGDTPLPGWTGTTEPTESTQTTSPVEPTAPAETPEPSETPTIFPTSPAQPSSPTPVEPTAPTGTEFPDSPVQSSPPVVTTPPTPAGPSRRPVETREAVPTEPTEPVAPVVPETPEVVPQAAPQPSGSGWQLPWNNWFPALR